MTELGTRFDFVSDNKFRESLESDYNEVVISIKAGAWKAVHVLCGSIVEAILLDYLCATDYKKRVGKDPLKLELSEAIQACKSEGVLSQKAADLSSVVRGYRNLIHPGRLIRLGETVSDNTAVIAKALVDIVIDEVSAGKADKYGFTAEQIVSKIAKDSSAVSVLRHFLKETNEFERERLVMDVIPARYFALQSEDSGTGLFTEVRFGDFEKCFRLAFEGLPVERKKAVSKKFVKILKEDSEQHVLSCETAFFRAKDLEFLSQDETALVKEHLVSRLQRERTTELFEALDGIGKWLNDHDIWRVANALMRAVVYDPDPLLAGEAKDTIIQLRWGMEDKQLQQLTERVTSWVDALTRRNMPEKLKVAEEIVQGLKPVSDDDIPF